MSNRLRNNLFAAFVVLVFLVGVAHSADPIVTNSTSNSTVTTSTDAKSTVKTNPPSAISPALTQVVQIYVQ